jgi:hypothetical protein
VAREVVEVVFLAEDVGLRGFFAAGEAPQEDRGIHLRGEFRAARGVDAVGFAVAALLGLGRLGGTPEYGDRPEKGGEEGRMREPREGTTGRARTREWPQSGDRPCSIFRSTTHSLTSPSIVVFDPQGVWAAQVSQGRKIVAEKGVSLKRGIGQRAAQFCLLVGLTASNLALLICLAEGQGVPRSYGGRRDLNPVAPGPLGGVERCICLDN